MKKFLTAMIILPVIAGLGCASMGENTKKGAGIGALTGAAIGGIVGHQSGHGWQGALIGGAAGAAGGGLIGKQMDKGAQENGLSEVEIVKMAQEGTPDDLIINEINRTKSTYTLTTETINYLKTNNVSDRVVDYMLSTAK